MDQGTTIGKIPIILITGFLGSGKTSLLKHILFEIGDSRKIAVVQNEFTPGSVDSVELESTGITFNLLEINNGSVFCACLLDDFISQLSDFIDKYEPEVIFLEATGLADPVSMAQILQSPSVENHIYLGGIWTVIDCVNFNKGHRYLQRVRHQVQIADLILLNKSDLLYPDENLTFQIKNWNPFAKKYIAKNGRFDNLNIILNRELDGTGHKTIDLVDIDKTDSLPRPDVGSCVIRTQKTFSEESIRQFHRQNLDIIYRMKGYTRGENGQYLLVQSVFDQLDISQTEDWTGPTEIILMGPGVKPGPITREFLKSGKNEKKNT